MKFRIQYSDIKVATKRMHNFWRHISYVLHSLPLNTFEYLRSYDVFLYNKLISAL